MKRKKVEVVVEYDEKADAAYVYFENPGNTVISTAEATDLVQVDFGPKGIIQGVEVLAARRQLPKQMLP